LIPHLVNSQLESVTGFCDTYCASYKGDDVTSYNMTGTTYKISQSMMVHMLIMSLEVHLKHISSQFWP